MIKLDSSVEGFINYATVRFMNVYEQYRRENQNCIGLTWDNLRAIVVNHLLGVADQIKLGIGVPGNNTELMKRYLWQYEKYFALNKEKSMMKQGKSILNVYLQLKQKLKNRTCSVVIVNGDNNYLFVKSLEALMKADDFPYTEVNLSAKGGLLLQHAIKDLINEPSQRNTYCLLRLPGVTVATDPSENAIDPYEFPVENMINELFARDKFAGIVVLPANKHATDNFLTVASRRRAIIIND